MTPNQLAVVLVDALAERGVSAAVGAAVQYGQKVALAGSDGTPLGNVVIYVGKAGPKLVDTELRPAGRALLPTIGAAWRAALASGSGASLSAVGPPRVAPLDRAEVGLGCYAAQLAELAVRAQRYGEHSGLSWNGLKEAIAVLARRADCPPPDTGPDGTRTHDWGAWAAIARRVAEQYGWAEQGPEASHGVGRSAGT